jgi:glucose/arabinose dehydrogenase
VGHLRPNLSKWLAKWADRSKAVWVGANSRNSLSVAPLFVVACLMLAGCGDDDAKRASPGPSAAPSARQTPTDKPSTKDRRRSRGSTPRAPAPHRVDLSKLETKTTKSGAVVILPPRPTATTTRPSGNCVSDEKGNRTVPPVPGLSARRVNRRTVTVVYRFDRTDQKCRPAHLEVTLDVSSDTLPGTGRIFSVVGSRGRVTLRVPRDLRRADVVRATARTGDGRPSTTASVLIR